MKNHVFLNIFVRLTRTGITVAFLGAVASCGIKMDGSIEAKNAGSRQPLGILAVIPKAGIPSGGTKITISGSGFSESSSVTLGDSACLDVSFVNTNTLTCTTPVHPVGAVPVTVANNRVQTVSLSEGFTFEVPPVITAIAPNMSALVGDIPITITGSGFLDGAIVTIDKSRCNDIKVLSSSQITCNVPSHAAGAVSVVVTNKDSQSSTLADGFSYNVAPTLTASASPATGTTTGSTKITISGTGFLKGITAKVDNTPCTNPTWVSNSEMNCMTPARVSLGTASITVTNPDNQKASRSNSFSYIQPEISFTVQPSNQTAANGTATFSATAVLNGSGNVNYQWQRELFSGGGFKNISGATSSTLILSNLKNHAHGFRYRVVTSFPQATDKTSSVAILTVPFNIFRTVESPTGGARDASSFLTSSIFQGGLVVDSDGNFIIASHNYLRKMTPEGTEIWNVGGTGSGDGKLSDAECLALGPDGKIYVSDQGNNRIQVFSSNGAYISKFGTSGTGNGQFDKPGGIALAVNGDVFISDIGNNRVQRYDANGIYISSFGTPGTGNGQFDTPRGLAINSLGKIFVVDRNNHRVQIFSSSGAFQTSFGTNGSADGQFTNPQGITIDVNGTVYVSDSGNQRVQVFDQAGTFTSKFGLAGDVAGTLKTPDWITTDLSGNIYVVNDLGGRLTINVFDADKNFGTMIGSTFGQQGALFFPHGITIDNAGKIYVTDTYNHAVQVFKSDGSFDFKVGGTAGTSNGAFDSPMGNIALRTDGSFYVSDTNNNRVQLFTALGSFTSAINTAVGSKPHGVVADGLTQFFVLESSLNRFRNLNLSAVELLNVGSAGSGDGNFSNPIGLSRAPSGSVIVTDTGNHRFQVFDSSGNFVLKAGVNGSAAGEFNWPMNPATDSTGNIYIADHYNHRVQVFGSDGTFKYKFGELGYSLGKFLYPTAVALDSSGKVYVVDAGNQRIQKFSCSDSSGAWVCTNEF